MQFACGSASGRLAFAAAIAVAASASNVAAGDDVDGSYRAFERHVAHCTSRFGYDPQALSHLGEYELAPGELEWRDCYYQGVREIVIPNSRVPAAYKKLVAEDRSMSKRIERREITRRDRAARLGQLKREIESAEKEAELQRMEKNRDSYRARQDEAKRMRKIRSQSRF